MINSEDEELRKLKQKKMERLMNTERGNTAFPVEKAVEITDSNFEKFTQQDGIVVVDTWAAWCMPCRTMSPIMDQLAKEWGNKGVHIGKLNVDKNRKTAIKYKVSSIPNFLVFKDGKYLGNIVGAVGKKPFVDLFKKLLKGQDPTREGYA